MCVCHRAVSHLYADQQSCLLQEDQPSQRKHPLTCRYVVPSRQESRLDKIDQALNERLQDTAQSMRDLTDDLFHDDWDRVRRILLSCKLLNAGGKLTKSSLLPAFRDLHRGDALILHVAEQNASLIIRRYR